MKRVSFAPVSVDYCHPHASSTTPEERKSLCWYSEEELVPSREDAKQAVEALQQVDGNIDAVDQNKGVCLRGIEKYANVLAKVMGQKKLIESVLQQQSLNRNNKTSGEEHIANVSRYLSKPFKEVAHYYALKTAEDEQKKREQLQQCQTDPTWIQIEVLHKESMKDINPQKRTRPGCYEERSLQDTSLHIRNVKRCVQVSE